MENKRRALGKGLEQLFNVESVDINAFEQNIVDTANQNNEIQEIKLSEIRSNPYQPRTYFNEEALNELAESIKENGVIQPIIVTKKGKGYSIVAGERRWRASRLAGLKVIPAIIRELSDQQTMEIALIENLQREDLNPLEEAYAMDNLVKKYKMSKEALAKKLGKSRSAVSNTIRLIGIDASLQDFIRTGELTAGHARALLALKTAEDQREVADAIIARDMSVRQAEEYVRKFIEDKENPKSSVKVPKKELSTAFTLSAKEVETTLKKSLGSKVKLKITDADAGRGKIIIDYKNYEDLDRLIEQLK